MRKALLACLGCLLLAPSLARADGDSVAQPLVERTGRNTLYVELLGNGGVYSFNYERFMLDDVSLRLGGGYISIGASTSGVGGTTSASASLLTIPITASFLGLRSGNHAFELGGGATIVYLSASASSSTGTGAFGSASGTAVAGTAIAGYRYAPVNGGLNFRAAFTPLFGQGGFLPWFGLAIGYGF